MDLRSNYNFPHVLYQSAEELSNKSLMLQWTEKKKWCNIMSDVKTNINEACIHYGNIYIQPVGYILLKFVL